MLEGVIVNTGTAAGLEIGGRFQANLAVAGSTSSARVVGSFATAE